VGAYPNVVANYYPSGLVTLLLKWDAIKAMVHRSENDIWPNVNVRSERNTPTVGADPNSIVKPAPCADDDDTGPCFQCTATMKKNVVSNLNILPSIEDDAVSNIKPSRAAG
jgi:hypothetical protein